MIKQNQQHLNRLLIIVDLMTLLMAFGLAWYVRFSSNFFVHETHLSFKEYLIPILIIAPLSLVCYEVFGLYTPQRYKHIFNEIINVLKANAIVGILLTAILFFYKEVHYSRVMIGIFLILSICFASCTRLVIRLILRKIRSNGRNLKHCIIVGCSSVGEEFLARVRANRHWGYNIIGFVGNEANVERCRYNNLPVIGNYDEISDLMTKYDVDEIIIAMELKEYDRLGKVISQCEKEGVKTQIIPDYMRFIPAKPFVEELDGLPVINIRHIPLDDVLRRVVKRGFDILFSFVAIMLLLPVLLVCTLMTKMTSPGPILFKQERVGLNRKSFNMYKFRSMKVQLPSEEKLQWTTKDDPRKTGWGSFMRKTSLDELPQFFNVLKGDMSVVGPRPERPVFVDKFKESIPKYMIKHQVRPGITGWAQVHGWRGDTSIEKRIEYDLYYIENWTFSMDIKIVILTVFKGFVNKNAY